MQVSVISLPINVIIVLRFEIFCCETVHNPYVTLLMTFAWHLGYRIGGSLLVKSSKFDNCVRRCRARRSVHSVKNTEQKLLDFFA